MLYAEYEESVISLTSSNGSILPGVDIDTFKIKGNGSISIAYPECEITHGEYSVSGKLIEIDSSGRAVMMLTDHSVVTSVFDRLITKGMMERNSYTVNCEEDVQVSYRTKEVTWEPSIVVKVMNKTEIGIKLSATVTSLLKRRLDILCTLSYGDYKCGWNSYILPGITRRVLGSKIVDAQQRTVIDIGAESVAMTRARMGLVFKAPFDLPKYAARIKGEQNSHSIYVEGMQRNEVSILIIGYSELMYATRVDGKRIEIMVDTRKKTSIIIRSCSSLRYSPKPQQYVGGTATWNAIYDPVRSEPILKVIDILPGTEMLVSK